MKILFITNGSIGDAIMSTGLIRYLLDTRPEATFTIVAGPAAAPLFEAFPRLDKVIVLRKQKWSKHWWLLLKEVWSTKWDTVVDLRGGVIGFLLGARERRIFHKPSVTQYKIEQLGAFFGLNPPPLPKLWVGDKAMQRAKELLPASPVIVMAPISNSPFKDWPIERFIDLALWLLKKPAFEKATIVTLAVQQQKHLIAPLVQALAPDQVLDLSGRTDMQVACAILKQAALFIGNDSGLVHMAGALGTPLIGLYGPTNDKIYAPRGAHVRIAKVLEFTQGEREIHDASIILRLTVAQVQAAVDDLLSTAATSSAA